MFIGSLHLDNRVILAPMAGISDLPYRLLMKEFGAGLVFTEMVSAKGLIYSGRKTRELLVSRDTERPLAIQLFGNDPESLAAAARQVNSEGDLIDINFGCPVNKVVKDGSGCALMTAPALSARILAAVRAATDLPLTIKIRSGWDNQNRNFCEIARIAENEGVDAISVHPRTRSQGFGGQANWREIAELKANLNIPVIGSGDIYTADDACRMIRQTRCDAVMIGRGGYGNPWLVRATVAALNGEPEQQPPGADERLRVALRHQALQVDIFGEQKALFEMRKHFCWYARGLPGAAAYRAAINRAMSIDEQRQLSIDFFVNETVPGAA